MHSLSRCIGVGPDNLLLARDFDNLSLRGPGGVIAENDVAVGEP